MSGGGTREGRAGGVGRLAPGLRPAREARATPGRRPATDPPGARPGPPGPDPDPQPLRGRRARPPRRAGTAPPGSRRHRSAGREGRAAGRGRSRTGLAPPGPGRGPAGRRFDDLGVRGRGPREPGARLRDLRQHHERGCPTHDRPPARALRAGRDGDLDPRAVRARPHSDHPGLVPRGGVLRGRVRPRSGVDRHGRSAPAASSALPLATGPSPLHVPAEVPSPVRAAKPGPRPEGQAALGEAPPFRARPTAAATLGIPSSSRSLESSDARRSNTPIPSNATAVPTWTAVAPAIRY